MIAALRAAGRAIAARLVFVAGTCLGAAGALHQHAAALAVGDKRASAGRLERLLAARRLALVTTATRLPGRKIRARLRDHLLAELFPQHTRLDLIGLARVLELPDTGWLRRYRVRAHGEVTQAQLDELRNGIEVESVRYGPIDATLERDQGANVWLVFAIREGKNREVRNVLAHLGLEVNRLIRISYGPFQLGELEEGAVDEVKTRVLREQLGEKVIAQAGADFAREAPSRGDEGEERPRSRKPFKPAGKSALIADRKGRRVLVQRTGSEEARARNEEDARGYGPPRRPKRGYHGKRDFKPRDE